MVGQNIGKYRVLDRVGRGGMGTVYKAIDETLHREVAIKVLNAELNDPEIAKRFRAEAITVARLSHPGIATVYELFEHEGQWLMVMEFVRGETLDRLVERGGALAPERAAEICMQALAALAHAHGLGVVHRDLKPANIMITEGGVIKIMDFGIARVAGTEHLTSAGFMMGTPAYMAPEQVMGHEIDARADIYSMGVVFYRLTTARLPFKGETPFAMAQSQVNDPPTPIRLIRTDLPPWAEQVVGRSLAKKPEDRFQSAIEFHQSLAAFLSGQSAPVPDRALAPTELLMTPPRAVPTATLERGATSGQIPVSAPADSGWQPTISAQTPVGLPSSSGSFAKGSTPVPAPAMGPPTGQAPQAAAAPIVAASPAVATAQKKETKSHVGVAAAVVLVLAVVAGTVWWRGREAPSPVVPSVVETLPPEPISTAADSSATPPATVGTPSTVPAGQTSPTPTVPGQGPATGQTPRAGASVAGTSAKAPTATSTPAAAGAAAAPPVVAETHEAFPNVKLAIVNGQKTSDRDVLLNFFAGQITAIPKNGGEPIFAVPYKNLQHATYVHARDPRWDETLPGPPKDLDVGGLLRTSKHWLVLQGETFFILKLEDSNIIRVLQVIESRTGLAVARPKGEK